MNLLANWFKRVFGKSKELLNEDEPIKDGFSESDYEIDYDLKTEGLEHVLGKMHNLVGHAIIPFEIGGNVDMYYFTNHIKGTGFATMELLDSHGDGPMKNRLGTYELVAFTKYEFNSSSGDQTPFNKMERNVCNFLTSIGFYSSEAALNPLDTIEVPGDENEENTCLVFDVYEPEGRKFNVGERMHHLLLCIQIFRSELDFARKNGSQTLIDLLKENDVYPYSDLDRAPLV